ncbi:MAG TPA: D-glycero-beta-D-manno-heptose 1-phosphate adenylyltransferase [Mariprofundaceae bacterium]|nr:D-glycero-beta-D-manno-heptose 1-phosphate adenylyltransferase [Mariprofundaceae bacterium]
MTPLLEAKERVHNWKREGKRVVFTNGCFDLLHPGHICYLQEAGELGDILVIGLNDDDSIRRLKGPSRPINPLEDRACMLAALKPVDMVIPFSEDTPLNLITALLPDVLVKGGDYQPDQIVGAKEVREHGGKVIVIPFRDGHSTTSLIARIREMPV